MISKIIANVSVVFAVMALSIVSMVFGYGVTPKSWTIVIGCSVFGQFMLLIMKALLDLESKEEKR